MNKQFFKSFILATMALISMYGFISCSKDNLNTSTTVDALANESVLALEQRGNLGKMGCYDLVFPVTIQFSDGTTKVITSQDSLHGGCKAWHEQNGGTVPHERPIFVFPIQVIAEDGSVITVTSPQDLQALKMACHKSGLDSLFHGDSLHHRGFPHPDTLCFTIVFPIQVKLVDGTLITINDLSEIKALANSEHSHGRGHGMEHGVPSQFQLVFPITVALADGASKIVNTADELKALRESCH